MARRGHGEGSLYQRKSDGRWAGSFRLPGGERKTVYAPKDNNRKSVALSLMKEARRKAESQSFVASNAQTVEAYLNYWITTIGGSKSVDLSTVENYRSTLQRSITALGTITLQKLTRFHVQQFINDLAAELKPNTVHLSYAILNLAMQAAVKWQYIAKNPCDDIILPRLEKIEQKILTAEQCQEFLKYLYGQDLEIFVILALGAGMRKGEICALRWADLDMEQGIIHINQIVYPLRGPDGKYRLHIDDPKSDDSKRAIPMASFVKSALSRQRTRQIQQKWKAARWEENDLVYCKDGKFMHPSTLHVRFKKALERAGLPEIKIHGLRHSCNTLLRKMGVDPVTRKQILGHSKVEITESDYGHTYNDLKIDAMARLNQLFDEQREAN